MHLIMPMGGAGTRFFDGGYECPKPLLELFGKPFFYWSTQSILKNIPVESLTFVVLREHIDRFSIDTRIREYYPQARIVVLPRVLKGAVLTCLAGIEGMQEDSEILFNDCDHGFLSSALEQFLQCHKDADGVLLTFSSREPKFSFLAYGEDGYVSRTVEKQVISEDAICGAYYFRSVGQFRRVAESYLQNCSYKEFFLSGVYNELIAAGGKVRGLPVDFHLPFGTPEEYAEAEKEEALLRRLLP
ncbi:MAG: glycosyltransferase family 2 protein [Oscillospiraceae bacterium]|nr:glycosyltransferase family 2 protein [Oscillospiraceae bacterium]